jgi:hypothetical protein
MKGKWFMVEDVFEGHKGGEEEETSGNACCH